MDGKHIFWNYDGKVTQSLSPFIATRTTGKSPPSLPQIITHDRNRVGTIMINRRFRDIVTSLIITRAQPSDSGTYACDPASPFSKSIRVVVTTGECTKRGGGRSSRQYRNGLSLFSRPALEQSFRDPGSVMRKRDVTLPIPLYV